MMSKDEIKFASKALEECASIVDHQTIGCDAENAVANAHEAISLLKVLAEQPAQQEPVAYLVDGDLYYPEEIDWETLQEQGHTVAALYTSPPAQRKPLTDAQIMAIGKEMGSKCRLGGNPNIDFDYARAIEAAHGIKENT